MPITFPVEKRSKIPKGHGQRGPNKLTKHMRHALAQSFHTLGGPKYLLRLAKDHPSIYCAMLSKAFIPAKVAVSATVMVDIGQAMIDAGRRQAAIDHDNVDVSMPIIDAEVDASIIEPEGGVGGGGGRR